jgi:hypothetical protein
VDKSRHIEKLILSENLRKQYHSILIQKSSAPPFHIENVIPDEYNDE